MLGNLDIDIQCWHCQQVDDEYALELWKEGKTKKRESHSSNICFNFVHNTAHSLFVMLKVQRVFRKIMLCSINYIYPNILTAQMGFNEPQVWNHIWMVKML